MVIAFVGVLMRGKGLQPLGCFVNHRFDPMKPFFYHPRQSFVNWFREVADFFPQGYYEEEPEPEVAANVTPEYWDSKKQTFTICEFERGLDESFNWPTKLRIKAEILKPGRPRSDYTIEKELKAEFPMLNRSFVASVRREFGLGSHSEMVRKFEGLDNPPPRKQPRKALPPKPPVPPPTIESVRVPKSVDYDAWHFRMTVFNEWLSSLDRPHDLSREGMGIVMQLLERLTPDRHSGGPIMAELSVPPFEVGAIVRTLDTVAKKKCSSVFRVKVDMIYATIPSDTPGKVILGVTLLPVARITD